MSKIQTRENKLTSRASEPGGIDVLIIVNNSSVTIHAMAKLRADTNTIYGQVVCYANSSGSLNNSTVGQDRIVNVFTETGNKIINATLTLNNTVLNQWSDLEISDVFEGITIDTTKTYTLTVSSVTNPPEYHSKFILKSFAKCPKQLVVKYSDPQSYSATTLPKKTEVLADDYYTSVLLPTLASSNPNYITFNCWAVVSTSTPVSTSTQIKENNVNLKALWTIKNGILYVYNNLSDSANVLAYDSGSSIIDSRSVMYNSSDSMLLGDGNYYKCTMLNVQTGYTSTFMLTLQDSSGNIVDTQYTDSYSGYIYYFDNYSPYHDFMTLYIDYISESESESYEESESESESGGGDDVVVHNNSPYTIYISVDSSSSYDVYGYSDYLIAQASNYYLIDPSGNYVTVVTEDSYGNVIGTRAVTTYDYFYDYYKTIKTIRIYGGSESESESGGESESGYESESESGGDFEYDTILVSQVQVLSTDTFQILFDAASLNDTVNIDWGDGTIETFLISDCMYTVDVDCYKVTLSHTYSQTGTYTITHSYNCYAPYDTTDNVDVIGTRVYMWPREAYRVVSFDIQKSADHRKFNSGFLKNDPSVGSSYQGNNALTYVNLGPGVTNVATVGFDACPNLTTLLMPGLTGATGDYSIYECNIITLDIGYKPSISVNTLYTNDDGTIQYLTMRYSNVVSVDSDEAAALEYDLSQVQTIYVPAELLSAYQNDSVWGQFFSKFAPLGGESESESESGSEAITEFYFYIEGDSSKYQYSFPDNLSHYQENVSTDKIRVVVTSSVSGSLMITAFVGSTIKPQVYDEYNNLISSATSYKLEYSYGLNGSQNGVNIYAGYTIKILSQGGLGPGVGPDIG